MNRVPEGNFCILCHKKLLGGTKLQTSYSSCNPITYELTRKLKDAESFSIVETRPYCTQENFGIETLVNLADRELFPKIFLTNIHRYMENIYSIYALTVAYFPHQ